MKIKCPKCGSEKIVIAESGRNLKDLQKCTECHKEFFIDLPEPDIDFETEVQDCLKDIKC